MSPANVVPGIGFSPDRMLQGRLFSYGDTQRYRLGVNHHQIPVNAPRCPVHNYHRDGAMRIFACGLPRRLANWAFPELSLSSVRRNHASKDYRLPAHPT